MSLQLMGNSIGTLRNPLGTFTIPHKCPHTNGQISFHFKVSFQKGFGVDG